MQREKELKAVLKKQQQALMALPNVVGVGIGYKRVGTQTTNELALLVFVEKKIPSIQLAADAVVPLEVEGFKTDVIEIGKVQPLDQAATAAPLEDEISLSARKTRWRPARPGVSLGHYQISAGTLGAIVYDRVTKKPLILSNNHVVANSSSEQYELAKTGDPIYQPGPYDGGKKSDTIGTLARFVKLTFAKDEVNQVDAGLVQPQSPADIDPDIWNIGIPKGMRAASLGLEVQKSGRTTGHTWGKVEVLDLFVQVDYGSGRIANFTNQIGCSAMSQGGDSGSLILDAELQAIGLLFAGSTRLTICSPIQTVCDLLAIELVSEDD